MGNKVFTALAEEAAFTSNILGEGVTQLAKANYAMRGLYFSSFSSISLGIERLGKLCILLDYYIRSDGSFPKEEYVRKFGHDLGKLYEMSHNIAKRNEIAFKHGYPDSDIHMEIMKLLTGFARGDRYANLTKLMEESYGHDPISEWHHKVDEPIYNLRVSERQKEKIRRNARIIDRLSSSFMMVRHTGEDRAEINSIEDASFRTGKSEAVAKYRQLYVVQIIRYWVELLVSLADIAREKNLDELYIPYFEEFFVIYRVSDAYLLTRKTY